MATPDTDPFALARQQAIDNSAADAAAVTPEDTSDVSEIVGQPELAESTNPEQVLVEEETVPEASAPTPVVEATPEV
jgi:hypothetical protein